MNTEGKTTIAPDVIHSIARLAILNVSGVSRLATLTSGKLINRSIRDGIRLEIQDNSVFLEIFLILHQDQNITQVARNVQAEVTRSVSELVGMSVERVDIHVEDIDYATNITD
jgi:uncharacterized alkaline shock family protein YloU